MKIKEILNEGGTGSLQIGVARALPAAYVFPELQNQDPYLQYRFGLAMASAHAVERGEVAYNAESAFGEKMTIIARSPEEERIIALAQAMYGPAGKHRKMISTRASEEAPDVNTQSPMQPKPPVKPKNRN